MKNNVDTLLTHVYEIEGLLLVMQRHQQEVPQLVIDRLKEAVNQLHDEAQLIENEPSPSTPVTEVAEQPAMPVTAQEPAPEPIKEEPAQAPAPDSGKKVGRKGGKKDKDDPQQGTLDLIWTTVGDTLLKFYDFMNKEDDQAIE